MGGKHTALGTQPGPDLFESAVLSLFFLSPSSSQRLDVMFGTTLARIVTQSLGIFAYPRRALSSCAKGVGVGERIEFPSLRPRERMLRPGSQRTSASTRLKRPFSAGADCGRGG